MSNIQLFSNNAKTTLSAQLLVGGLTMTVAGGGGALFRTVAAPNFEKITLQRESDGAIEIITVTTHTAANDTFAVIARGAEGTTPLQFEVGDKVQGRWTRETGESFTQGIPFTGTPGTLSIDMQASRANPATIGVTGNNSVAVGREITIGGSGSVGIGTGITITGSSSVAIGDGASAAGSDQIALGAAIMNAGNQSIGAGGSNLQVTAYRAIAIGWDGHLTGDNSIGIGYGIGGNAGNYSVAIGTGADGDGNYNVVIGPYAAVSGNDNVALGHNASAGTGNQRVVIGAESSATAGNGVGIGYDAAATGYDAIAIGPYSIAGGGEAVVIGRFSQSTDPYVVVVGSGITSTGYYSVTIGSTAETAYKAVAIGAYANGNEDYAVSVGYASAAGERSVSVGYSALSRGTYNVAIGDQCYVGVTGQTSNGSIGIGQSAAAQNTNYAISIGYQATIFGGGDGMILIGGGTYLTASDYAVAIGYGAYVNGAARSIGLGFEARPGDPNIAHIAAPIVNVLDDGNTAFGDAGQRLRMGAGVEVVLMSNEYDLTDVTPFDGGTLGTKDFWVMPGGTLFYPDEVGIVTETQNTVTTGPTASFGHGGAGTQVLNNQLFANAVLGQAGGRGEYASAAPQGVGTVSIAMNGAATATALTGRFYVRGMMVQH